MTTIPHTIQPSPLTGEEIDRVAPIDLADAIARFAGLWGADDGTAGHTASLLVGMVERRLRDRGFRPDDVDLWGGVLFDHVLAQLVQSEPKGD